ncbi:hypothetical protein [Segatella salivae]|uniref:hypothetical protein n=1 Tax=Segatella salivae TaxID=228604 RepID=UPI001C5E90AC|nr:hypothetical protein [Segatella salivae]
MRLFRMLNVVDVQCCGYYNDFLMNVFNIVIALMVQCRRCCSFDSPGLARNEPTPGQRSQGDSTP